jgi:hypothetical protein
VDPRKRYPGELLHVPSRRMAAQKSDSPVLSLPCMSERTMGPHMRNTTTTCIKPPIALLLERQSRLVRTVGVSLYIRRCQAMSDARLPSRVQSLPRRKAG